MFSYHGLFVLDPTMKTEGGWGSVQQGGSVQWYLTGANMFGWLAFSNYEPQIPVIFLDKLPLGGARRGCPALRAPAYFCAPLLF